MERDQQYDVMRKFCRRCVESYCWGYSSDPDGGELQDWAEELGLIEPRVATEADAHNISDVEPGDTFYRFADWLDKPRQVDPANSTSQGS